MAKLIYVANTSLDGYTEDPEGGINWGTPDEEYFSFINDLERTVGTYLYGRRMYESMIYWETAPTADQPPWIVEFSNIWRAADKIVFSKTLASVSSDRTALEREFDVEAIRRTKAAKPATSRWEEPIWPPKRSGRTWWTSATCSSGQSCWEVASAPFPPTTVSTFNCSMNDTPAVASPTFTTASSGEDFPPGTARSVTGVGGCDVSFRQRSGTTDPHHRRPDAIPHPNLRRPGPRVVGVRCAIPREGALLSRGSNPITEECPRQTADARRTRTCVPMHDLRPQTSPRHSHCGGWWQQIPLRDARTSAGARPENAQERKPVRSRPRNHR